jgi:hypothetical protein
MSDEEGEGEGVKMMDEGRKVVWWQQHYCTRIIMLINHRVLLLVRSLPLNRGVQTPPSCPCDLVSLGRGQGCPAWRGVPVIIKRTSFLQNVCVHVGDCGLLSKYKYINPQCACAERVR